MGDTVSLSADRIEENRQLLYTQKTGMPVNNVLPEFVLRAMAMGTEGISESRKMSSRAALGESAPL
jgi:hypothetical protein